MFPQVEAKYKTDFPLRVCEDQIGKKKKNNNSAYEPQACYPYIFPTVITYYQELWLRPKDYVYLIFDSINTESILQVVSQDYVVSGELLQVGHLKTSWSE